jgi:hypothetical protein
VERTATNIKLITTDGFGAAIAEAAGHTFILLLKEEQLTAGKSLILMLSP